MRDSHLSGLAALVLLAASPAAAREVETAHMTWPEIRDAVAAGATTIIIPTGGTEPNGAHMATGKHNAIVAETARRIAAELGDALVAPVLAYTPEGDLQKREGHTAYPGAISVTPDAFAAILDGAARSFAAHSFKTIVFLGDSGPNQAPQRALAARLSAALSGDGVCVINADAYYGGNGQVEALKAEGETEATIGVHAGIRDTSELLAVAPGDVRLDRRAADRDGASGDPSRATAERGERMIKLKVAAAVAEIRVAQKRDRAAASPAPSLFSRLWRIFFG